jgi:adenylate cyclase
MYYKNWKARFNYLIGLIVYWILALLIYDIIRYSGISSETEAFSLFYAIEVASFLGLITGILFFVFDLLLEREWIRKQNYLYRIFIKVGLYCLVFLIDDQFGAKLLEGAGANAHLIDIETMANSGITYSFGLFFMISTFLYVIGQILNEKFGPGNFFKMLIGKYTPPKVERKVFLFLDMQSSTTIAEELGYTKFSKLVQRCFIELNHLIPKYKGQIYQYVGDEAVIVWDYDKALQGEDATHLYYDFSECLMKLEPYFKQNFGVQPFFKAGIHGGDVVTAEIGIQKKDMSYLGDVVNTAARIQNLCNPLKQKLLISGELVKDLPAVKNYRYDEAGRHLLKGKIQEVDIYSVHIKDMI